MHARQSLVILFLLANVAVNTPPSFAIDPNPKSYLKDLGIKLLEQEMLEFELYVVDANGDPVVAAEVEPWALYSSQGHGSWQTNKAAGDAGPESVKTDAMGKATVVYPKFANVKEQIATSAVTVSVDHAEHPFVSHEDVKVPCDSPHRMALPVGAAVEVAVSIDGERVTKGVAAITSGGRAGMKPGLSSASTESGTFRIPPMAKGSAQFMVIRLEEERPTHFGPVETVEIDGSEDPVNRTVELLPAVRVRGRLDDSVPRPVKNGRVKVETINAGLSWDEINWFSWAEVNEDGTFVIEEWPANQPIQLIALCDGFIAKSGEKPAMVKPERAVEGRLRPQVFMKPGEAELVVEMTPLIACNIQVVNGFGKPVQGADIVSAPNVSWWNGGSQIYGWPLVSSTQLLLPGKYERLDGEGIHAQPFKGTTDEDGRLTLGLPVGRESLWAVSKRYQLPINAGRRMHGLEIAADKPVNATLVLQPRGLDVLGDWEDLCGFVFG